MAWITSIIIITELDIFIAVEGGLHCEDSFDTGEEF
jgi:hypothetical protein